MSHDHPSEPGLSPAPGDPGTAAIAAALAALRPVPARLDRDRTLFEAGRASARPAAWPAREAWPAVAASLLAVVVGQAALLARRPEPAVVERIVLVDRPVPAAGPAGPPAPAAPLLSAGIHSPTDRLAWQLVRYGLDGLPGRGAWPSGAAVAGSGPALSGRELAAGALLQQELEQVRNPPGDGL